MAFYFQSHLEDDGQLMFLRFTFLIAYLQDDMQYEDGFLTVVQSVLATVGIEVRQ